MAGISRNLPLEEVDIFSGNVDITQAPGSVLNVKVVDEGPSTTVTTPLLFAEISSVPAGVETIIVTYTVPPGVFSFLVLIDVAGINNALYSIYRNTLVIDKQYTTYGAPLNSQFTFEVPLESTPGLQLAGGDVIKVTVLQQSASLGTFSAKIQAVEMM